MNSPDFEIYNGALLAYRGTASTVTLPDTLGDIGCNTFRDCSSLTEIVIPAGVTLLGYSAFHGCKSLSSVTIPQSVVSIGKGIFSGCERLTRIIYNGTRAEWAQIAKADRWDDGMGTYAIACADGVIE